MRNVNGKGKRSLWLAVCVLWLVPAVAVSHGDINPQPVDTKGLEPIGQNWRATNPYRGNKTAIAIGKSAYNQQCARCHGLEGVSGGLAPDLRSLDKGDEGGQGLSPPYAQGRLPGRPDDDAEVRGDPGPGSDVGHPQLAGDGS